MASDRAPKKDLTERIFSDDREVDRAVRKGITDALKLHRSLGNSIPMIIDGQIVLVPANEIPDPQKEGDAPSV